MCAIRSEGKIKKKEKKKKQVFFPSSSMKTCGSGMQLPILCDGEREREKEDHHLSLLGDFSYTELFGASCNAIRQMNRRWFWLFWVFFFSHWIDEWHPFFDWTFFRIFFFDGIVFVAADRSALSHRFVLSQRRHLQILRSRWRTRLPVNWLIYFSLTSIHIPCLFLCVRVWKILAQMSFFFFLFCVHNRCAEGYKGQRCENKDIYNLGSKSSVWAF